MAIRKCPSCGATVPEGFRFCTECGISIPDNLQPVEENIPQAAPAPEIMPAPMVQPVPEYQSAPTYQPAPSYQPAPAPQYSEPAEEKGKKKRQKKAKTSNTVPEFIIGTKFEPVTSGGFVGIYFLMMIPIVNLIFLIVWACGGCRKINKRNWARSQLVMILIGIIALLLLAAAVYGFLKLIGVNLDELFKGNYDAVFSLFELNF